MEQQAHQRVGPCFLPTYPSTKSNVFCPSRSTPPPRRTRTQGRPSWHNHSRSTLAVTNYSPPKVMRLMFCNQQCRRRWWQLTRHDHSHTIGFSNNHSTPNLTRVKWRDWQGWWRWLNTLSRTAVEARLGALVRALNTDALGSNACTKCGTSCIKEDRATQPC